MRRTKESLLKKKLTIEDKLLRLEEISQKIEGDTPLETAIALYKEGLGLIEELGAQLKKHEAEVSLLKKSADGIFALEPFETTA